MTKEHASINIFHILKSVMDYKVRPLKTAANDGERAALEETQVRETISGLCTYITNNKRYNPRDAREAEEELNDYEEKLSKITNKINKGKKATEQLTHANKFYSAYEKVCNQFTTAQKIQKLESQRNDLENRLSTLDNRIEACTINMTPNLYSEDIAEQSNRDYEYYNNEYGRIHKELLQVIADIKSLQHQ